MLITKISPLTGFPNTLDLPISELQFDLWNQGTLIQHAMPHLTSDQREFLITGLYPGEFEKLDFDEDDEDDSSMMLHN